jgi:hypothetical protein
MLITTGAWRRDLAGMRQRRLEAARVFVYGATQAEVTPRDGRALRGHAAESVLSACGRLVKEESGRSLTVRPARQALDRAL